MELKKVDRELGQATYSCGGCGKTITVPKGFTKPRCARCEIHNILQELRL